MLAPARNGLRRSHLTARPTLTAFGAAFFIGVLGAWLVVRGADGFLNPLLAIGAGALHATAVILVITVATDLCTAASPRTQKWSDLGPFELGAFIVLGLAAIGLAVWIDWTVARGSVPPHYGGLHVAACVGLSLAAAAVTIHAVRPGTDRHQRPAVAALAALAGLAIGATSTGTWAGVAAWAANNDVPTGPDLSTLPPITGIHGTYVALGDSYSAGEGLGPFDTGTEGDCHRSSRAYPRLLRFAGQPPAELFAACSGAVSFDVFGTLTAPDGTVVQAPQIDGQVHPEVGLVTITIGGNDVVFSKVVVHCFTHTDCLHTTFVPPQDDPARDLRFPKRQPLDTWAHQALSLVRGKVATLYPRLRTTFPNARIVAIGYPYLFPAGPPDVFGVSDCQTVLRRFSQGEREEVRALQDELNDVLYHQAIVAGIEFVSPMSGWSGHEPCGGESRYTNAIKPNLNPGSITNVVDGGTFHPNVAGQRELARTVQCYLHLNPAAPMPDPSQPASGSPDRPLDGC